MPDPDAQHSFLRPLAYWIFVTLALLTALLIVRKLTPCVNPAVLPGDPPAECSTLF